MGDNGTPTPLDTRSVPELREELEKQQLLAELTVIRESQQILGNYVDPWEPYFDNSEFWHPIGALHDDPAKLDPRLRTDQGLRMMRAKGRWLDTYNEFAINAYTNRVNYTVGVGFPYSVVPTDQGSEPDAISVKKSIKEFIKANQWSLLERELVRRCDRDGEAFIWMFPQESAPLQVRTIEPEKIQTPPNQSDDETTRQGIITAQSDVATVLGYYHIDEGDIIPADEIVHIKMNVDRTTKRGIPTMFPVWSNLQRAEKLLKNMSTVAGIQAAIAIVRKHVNSSQAGVKAFADNDAEFSRTDPFSLKNRRFRVQRTAEIIDAPKGIDYDFPASNANADKFVSILQAELRSIASRLTMPEFMLTSDASNANFSSTMVAEGPAVKNFKALQTFFKGHFMEVIFAAIRNDINRGELSEDILEKVEIQCTPPMVEVRDRLKFAQAFEIEKNNGVRSPQSWSREIGLDYETNQSEIDEHLDQHGGRITSLALPPEEDEGEPSSTPPRRSRGGQRPSE